LNCFLIDENINTSSDMTNIKLIYVFIIAILITIIYLAIIENHLVTKRQNNPTFIQNYSSTRGSTRVASTAKIIHNTLFKPENIAQEISLNTSNNVPCKSPILDKNIETRLEINQTAIEFDELYHELMNKYGGSLKYGGKSTNECRSSERVAIIIPYRKRANNMRIFLRHLHPLLQRQQISYGIYFIEPLAELIFNRGLLLNIGFLESQRDGNNTYDCFIFHDVDLIPEDERILYECSKSPKHMSSAVSTMKYQLPYKEIFGGVTALDKSMIYRLNGYSNLYFGWGGEDDDFYQR
jgi:hypothetical protein